MFPAAFIIFQYLQGANFSRNYSFQIEFMDNKSLPFNVFTATFWGFFMS